MRMKWFLILIVFLLHIPSAIAQEQNTGNPFLDNPDIEKSWGEPVVSDNEVKIFNRKSIVKEAAYKDCKGVVTINTTLNSIIRLLEDTEVSHLWMHNCVSARKVSEDDTKKESIKHFKTSQRKMLMDFKNDSVVRNTIQPGDKTKVVTISIMSAEALVPEESEYKRIKKLYGKWVLTPKLNNRVEVVYELNSEPENNIPFTSSLVESGLREHMFIDLKSMKEVLECRHERINCQRYNEGKEYVKEFK